MALPLNSIKYFGKNNNLINFSLKKQRREIVPNSFYEPNKILISKLNEYIAKTNKQKIFPKSPPLPSPPAKLQSLTPHTKLNPK